MNDNTPLRRSRKRVYLRFLWSHESKIHRQLVRVFNRLLYLVPFSIKYGLGTQLRRKSPPYHLIEPGSTVVQVGAPSDTLFAGRSRGMYFSLFVGKNGKVVLVEPDQESLENYKKIASRHSVDNFLYCPKAAWSEEKTLRIYIDESHPASNFTEGTKEYPPERLSDYRLFELPADTIDNILLSNNVNHVHLVSITTNGAEQEILKGMLNTIAHGLPYIALARTGENYLELMGKLGYELLTHDDRGFTFSQVRKLTISELQNCI
jgi:FkbM family methyltransferase